MSARARRAGRSTSRCRRTAGLSATTGSSARWRTTRVPTSPPPAACVSSPTARASSRSSTRTSSTPARIRNGGSPITPPPGEATFGSDFRSTTTFPPRRTVSGPGACSARTWRSHSTLSCGSTSRTGGRVPARRTGAGGSSAPLSRRSPTSTATGCASWPTSGGTRCPISATASCSTASTTGGGRSSRGNIAGSGSPGACERPGGARGEAAQLRSRHPQAQARAQAQPPPKRLRDPVRPRSPQEQAAAHVARAHVLHREAGPALRVAVVELGQLLSGPPLVVQRARAGGVEHRAAGAREAVVQVHVLGGRDVLVARAEALVPSAEPLERRAADRHAHAEAHVPRARPSAGDRALRLHGQRGDGHVVPAHGLLASHVAAHELDGRVGGEHGAQLARPVAIGQAVVVEGGDAGGAERAPGDVAPARGAAPVVGDDLDARARGRRLGAPVAVVDDEDREVGVGLCVEGVERAREVLGPVARGDRHSEKGSHGANIIAAMPLEPQSAQLVLVSLDAPLEPIEVEERHDHVLMVVTLGTTVLGEVLTPVGAVLGIEAQREAITSRLGERIWRERLAADFTRAVRAPRVAEEPRVSIVVCTRGTAGPELAALLDSLVALEPAAHELIVVQSGPNDGSLRAACADYPVRCVDEPVGGLARARNRGVAETTGDVVAFAEPGWVVDPRWLAGLGRAFEDSLVMAVKGYTAPGGHSVGPETYDRIALKVPHLPEGNCFYRRDAFVRASPFAEFLGAGHESEMHYRLAWKGWRVAYRPAHLALAPFAVRRSPFAEGVGAGAAATYALLARRDFSVFAPAGTTLPPGERGVKANGGLLGPFALLWSWLRPRGVEPIPANG